MSFSVNEDPGAGLDRPAPPQPFAHQGKEPAPHRPFLEAMAVAADARSGVDPKGAVGASKPALVVIPPAVLLELGAAMSEGAIKYGPHNWRSSGGVVSSTYVNGALRHLLAWLMGEDKDPDSGSGLSHLTKAMASLCVLRDAQLHGVATDDRPEPSPPELIAEITAAYAAMVPAAEAKAAELRKG